jgi:adenosine kinase
MISHAAQLAAAQIPFIFDPGQGLPMFDGAELLRFVDQASWVAVNDYEGRMLQERTGLSAAEISRRAHIRGVIVTLGAAGCELWIGGQSQRVPGVAATAVLDPTGCGDAFRGALLYGLERGWDLARCAELGNRIGAIKIATAGVQNHRLDPAALGLAP